MRCIITPSGSRLGGDANGRETFRASSSRKLARDSANPFEKKVPRCLRSIARNANYALIASKVIVSAVTPVLVDQRAGSFSPFRSVDCSVYLSRGLFALVGTHVDYLCRGPLSSECPYRNDKSISMTVLQLKSRAAIYSVTGRDIRATKLRSICNFLFFFFFVMRRGLKALVAVDRQSEVNQSIKW